MRRPLLALAAASSLLVLAAACSDEEGGDDPLPITPTRCAIYWARENPVDDPPSLDFFAVDQPIASWTTGTNNYGGAVGSERDGTFAYRSPDGSLALAESVGVTTSGEFQLSIEGVAPGDDVGFSDTVGQLLVDARTPVSPAVYGTAGVGTFTGVWSALDAQTSAAIDWADVSSTVTVLFLGSTITLGGNELGGMSAYAQCYDADAQFAPAPLRGGRIFRPEAAASRGWGSGGEAPGNHALQNSMMVRSGTRPGKGSR